MDIFFWVVVLVVLYIFVRVVWGCMVDDREIVWIKNIGRK